MKKRIIAWLEGTKDYTEGLALYYEAAPSPKRVYPAKPTCKRCTDMLELDLKSLLVLLPDDDAPASSTASGTQNLDALSYTEIRTMFLELGYKPANLSKAKMLETLKAHFKNQ